MEIADVKRQVIETIERSRRRAAERRTRADEAGREFQIFLDQRAIPLLRQIANVLKVESFHFTVFTPGGSVRLSSDRTAEDYIELTLDTTGEEPVVTGRSSRGRGRRVIESEERLGPPAAISESHLLSFVLKGLEPLVDR